MAEIIWQYLNPGRLTPIEEALARQEELLEGKIRGDPCDYILFAEHDHVYTYPYRVADKLDSLCRFGKDNLPARIAEIFELRGGSITYHGPGQLVCYFIVDLTRLDLFSVTFGKLLDKIVIEALAQFGVCAHGRPENLPDEVSGAWVTMPGGAHKKIAARGIRGARKYVWQENVITTSGIAPNIQTNLRYFDSIYPCGHDIQMTSVKEVTGKECDLQDVAKVIAEIAIRELNDVSRCFQKHSVTPG